jgi:hypothetical protein
MTVQVNGDPRMFDWSRLGRGRPATDMIQDMAVRRALDANNQNIEYLLRKFQDIRDRPDDDKYTLSNITRLPNGKKKVLWPQCVMVSANWIKPNSSVIQGLVMANGFDTSYYFQYTYVNWDTIKKQYPSPDFSNIVKMTTKDAGSGMLAISVSESMTGLTVPARYYFQIVAWNEKGKAFSNWMSTDIGKIPQVDVQPATSISRTGATIHGDINPNSVESTYRFAWGLDRSCPNLTNELSAGSGSSSIPVESILSSLTNKTIYYFKLIGTNALGQAISSIQQFLTKNNSPTVQTLVDSSRTDRSTQMNGSVNPNGLATIYYFEWGYTQSYGNTTPVLSAGTGVSDVSVNATISGLRPGWTYVYRVVATNADGITYGNAVTIMTDSAEIQLTGTLNFAHIFSGDTGTETVIATVKNVGLGTTTLDWTGVLTLDSGLTGKVTMDVSSGHLQGQTQGDGQSQNITLTLSKTGISSGSYTGTLTISAPYLDDKTLPISLQVVSLYLGQVKFTSRTTRTYVRKEGTADPPPATDTTETSTANQGSYPTYVPGWASAYIQGSQMVLGRTTDTKLWTAIFSPDITGTTTLIWAENEITFDGNSCPIGVMKTEVYVDEISYGFETVWYRTMTRYTNFGAP